MDAQYGRCRLSSRMDRADLFLVRRHGLDPRWLLRHRPLTLAGVLLVLIASVACVPIFLAARPSPSFFMIQLSDPQFGMEHFGTERRMDWLDEQAMLNLSIREVNRLAPRFVVLTGDIQNELPITASGQQVGAAQVVSVKQSLSLLDGSIPLRSRTPGNHDVGDTPTLDTLDLYTRSWGADRGAFDEGGIRFISLDSQIYWNASSAGVSRLADEQTAWFANQLDDAAERGAAGVVVLTHIAPFVVGAQEPTGWANWPKGVRRQVLRMSQRKPVPPSVIINGHFHMNVDGVRSDAFGAPVEIITSSSVGCPVAWNGSEVRSPSGGAPHSLASALAAERTGYGVFMTYVVRNGDKDAPADFSLVPERVRSAPNLSGVRIFEFDARTGYRHKWFTLAQLSELRAPLAGGSASPLASLPFSRWSTPVAPVTQRTSRRGGLQDEMRAKR